MLPLPPPVEEMVIGEEPKTEKAEHVVFPEQDTEVVAIPYTSPEAAVASTELEMEETLRPPDTDSPANVLVALPQIVVVDVVPTLNGPNTSAIELVDWVKNVVDAIIENGEVEVNRIPVEVEFTV